MTPSSYSLQRRLALRLALVFVSATILALAGFLIKGYATVEALRNRAFDRQAADLARYLVVDDAGKTRLALPPELVGLYQNDNMAYVIRAGDGGVIAESGPAALDLAKRSPPPAETPRYFEIHAEGSGAEFYGLAKKIATAAGPVQVTIAERAGSGEAFLHTLFDEFVGDLLWMVVPFVAITLLVGHLTLRNAFRAIHLVSRRAAAINPSTTAIRLPESGVPEEILPLITAVNSALNRLEKGFRIQREFTANAAHQLRTPLSVLTARLDSLADTAEVRGLRADVARMNRLVGQLLKVTRLDSFPPQSFEAIDLRRLAADTVSYLAPLAIRRGKAIALTGTKAAVSIQGNAAALNDALANLIENALAHAPDGTTVEVEVLDDGTVRVIDEGPGIPAAHRSRVVERFWRGDDGPPTGAGLGLAIVAEIARLHDADLIIDDRPGGGAIVGLRLYPY